MAIVRDGQDPSGYMGLDPVKTPPTVKAQRSATTTDRRYKIGTMWINQATDGVQILTNVAAGSATWITLS